MTRVGLYSLKFFYFYNCYDLTQFASNDCRKVQDKLTIYSKSDKKDTYLIVEEVLLNIQSSVSEWQENAVDLNLTSDVLFVIIYA